MTQPLLSIKNLHLSFKTNAGELQALVGISLDVQAGEIFGIVGETGCGKTVTGLSVLGLLPSSATISEGKITVNGTDMLSLSRREMERMRGSEVAMIFQNPLTSLNPVFSVGEQLTRVIRQHLKVSRNEARQRAEDTLESVALPDVSRIMKSYPHQLSGGMQQRVMIALALSCEPSLLIADEPTTALDVTIQAQILSILKRLRNELGIAIVMITHDLGVVAETCDRVAVLYAGRVIECGQTRAIFENPQHPYTQGLIAAVPRPDKRGGSLTAIPGSVPANPGAVVGCAFAPRCDHAFERCWQESPEIYDVSGDHRSACFLHLSEEASA